MHIQGSENKVLWSYPSGYLCDSHYFAYPIIMKIKALGLDEAMKFDFC